ncbi:MAG: hypothetical protein PHS32_10925 [Rhodoferax sp.]|nr:hypothetical protein [Rhodoferax sp.]MDD5334245.1 hypothetical protein [Rhodoferax sp.]
MMKSFVSGKRSATGLNFNDKAQRWEHNPGIVPNRFHHARKIRPVYQP